MAVIGTFGSFTAARLGIYASQASLNVTGHNIANINTDGFTRQRMDLRSVYGGAVDRYVSKYSVNIGYGVLTEGVSQIRDPYIDIRYRTEQANEGQNEYWLKGLDDLATKLDEVGDGKGEFGIIERQFNDLVQQLQNLSEKTGSEEYDTLVRGSADTLAELFRDYAKGLEEIKTNKEEEFDKSVSRVNTILTNIRNLNESIRKANICGDKALELRDERNVQIDELSKLVKINVTYDMERIDQYSEVERLNIRLADDEGRDVCDLVRGIYAGQLSYQQVPMMNPDYDPNDPASEQYIKDPDTTPPTTTDVVADAFMVKNDHYDLQVDTLVDRWDHVFVDKKAGYTSKTEPLADDVMVGGLQAQREFLTEEGEFASKDDIDADAKADIKRGILYYQKSLDALANKFAQIMNEANQLPMEKLAIAYAMDSTTGQLLDKASTDTAPVYLTVTVKRDDTTKPDLKLAGMDNDGDWVDDLGNKLLDDEGNPLDLSTLSYSEKQQILDQLRENGTLTDAYRDGDGNPTYKGGPLFSNGDDGDDTEGITASNITVSHSWANRQIQIMNTLRENEKVVSPPQHAICETGVVVWPGEDAQDGDIVPLTIGGITAYGEVGEGKDTVQSMLTWIMDQYNNDTANTDWSASWNENKNGLVFTAKTPGSIETTGAAKPQGTYLESSGSDGGEVVTITHNTANDNIDHIIAQIGTKFKYNTQDMGGDAVPSDYFTGTFQEFFTNMSHTLATDQEKTAIKLNNHEIQSLDLENQRQSVSGVDLNDEATNMMQFQKSYQAACKLLTTLDSMLNTLINNTI